VDLRSISNSPIPIERLGIPLEFGYPVSIGFTIGPDAITSAACKNAAWYSKPLVYRPIRLERDPSSERGAVNNAIRERVSRVSGLRSLSPSGVPRARRARRARLHPSDSATSHAGMSRNYVR